MRKRSTRGQGDGLITGAVGRRVCRVASLLLPLPLLLTAGCLSASDKGAVIPSSFHLSWFDKPTPPPAPADSLVLRGDHLEPEKAPGDGKGAAELAGAKELYRRGEYAAAEKIFHQVAGNTKNPTQVAEEARYYEADCLRLQMHYPKAADTYKKCLDDFPSGLKHDEANKRMFDIANYWLDDTRKEMEATKQNKGAKPWYILPTSFVHFEKTKPLLDMEGRALDLMEYVHINDPVGPLGEKALFYLGSVRFFREDYKDADHYFGQIVNTRPNSELAPKAVELGIIAKQLSTGGPEYDGRKCEEARQLIDTALRSYPELVEKKGEFLERQIWSINQQEAEKDFRVAEFYRRTGHPGAAYFYYELVRRRYPGTKYAKDASAKMEEVRGKLEAAKKTEVTQKRTDAAPKQAPEQKYVPPVPQWTRPTPPEMAPQPRAIGLGTPQAGPELAPTPRSVPPDLSGGR